MATMQPYRTAQAQEALISGGKAFASSIEETCLGDMVFVGPLGGVSKPRMFLAHAVLGLIIFGSFAAAVLMFVFGVDGAPGMLVFAVIFAAIFGWVWHSTTKGHRAGVLINKGDRVKAERVLGTGWSAIHGRGMPLALAAQLRGDHAMAAEVLQKLLAEAEKYGGVVPMHRAAYGRLAISLTNLGRNEDASVRIRMMGPSKGDYQSTMGMVARAYLAMAAGQPIAPGGEPELQAMAEHFRRIRGSWGGLALAGFGYYQLGNTAMAQALVGEERTKVKYDQLAVLLPGLWKWMNP